MSDIRKATFAGGCFWCMVKPFDEYPGVKSIVVGYTGGTTAYPTYEEVCSKQTGHQEAVQITYDEQILSYRELVEIFFRSIDPTDLEGQFYDRGETYHTAIFYHDDYQKEVATTYKSELAAKGIFEKPIVVPIKPATTFYEAEKEHQDYYKKEPFRYGMYYKGSGREKFLKNTWSGKQVDKGELREKLTPIQYQVTQENGTEPPFQNAYHNHQEAGIYVDIVSGKPLFSSLDKFQSGCGWPAFSKPIVPSVVYEKNDLSHGMTRVEVRSQEADSHLGHVFEDGPINTGGLRYCINSAALKFIPKDQLEKEGYGVYRDKC